MPSPNCYWADRSVQSGPVQPFDNERAVCSALKLAGEAIDFEERKRVHGRSRRACCVALLVELGVGSREPGMYEIVVRVGMETRFECRDGILVASVQIEGPSDGFEAAGAQAGVELLRDRKGLDGVLRVARPGQN